MDPSIEPALIAGAVSLVSLGGTVAVAIAGFRNSRRAAKETAGAGTANTVLALDAARADRLWEAQAAVYTDAIRIVRHRVLTRRELIRTARFRYDDETERRMKEWVASAKPSVERAEVEARMLAFCSSAVLEAVQAAGAANDEVFRLHHAWVSLTARREPPGRPVRTGDRIAPHGRPDRSARATGPRLGDRVPAWATGSPSPRGGG